MRQEAESPRESGRGGVQKAVLSELAEMGAEARKEESA